MEITPNKARVLPDYPGAFRFPEGSKFRTPLVLVVEADLFALTSRVDPNVIFWEPGVAKLNSVIPSRVTHIWISKHTNLSIRLHLSHQAKERGIEVWECTIQVLGYKLNKMWGDPANSGALIPVDWNSSLPEAQFFTEETNRFRHASDAPAESFQAEPKRRGRRSKEEIKAEEMKNRRIALNREGLSAYKSVDSAPVTVDQLMEEVMDKIQEIRAKAPVEVKTEEHGTVSEKSTTPVIPFRKKEKTSAKKVVPTGALSLQEALKKIPTFDRKLFMYHYCVDEQGNVSTSCKSETETAEEFCLPASKVRKTLDQIWGKLHQQGFVQEKTFLPA